MSLEAIEITTGPAPELAVIWLHGLGADGHDFEPIVPELGLRFPVRFVFPHARMRQLTANGGMPMRAWYDILGWSRNAPEDSAGIRGSATAVSDLIDREVELGMPPERIVLAGFSQGGAVALFAALRESRRLAGVLALSTYLPLPDTLAKERSAANAAVPILMIHGTNDAVLPLSLGESSCRTLEALGYRVDWRTYPIAHTVCMEEISAIGVWLASLTASRAEASVRSR